MDSGTLASIKAAMAGEGSPLARMLNALALLREALGPKSWVGLYVYEEKTNKLNLGPFQGSPACVSIRPGKGVVGTCYAAKKPLYVDDVNEFPGYVSCDACVKSEACFPLFAGDDVIGVLDVDSPELDGLKGDLTILMAVAHLFEG
ncbi:MAG: GAF domain-containing protein [Bacilli bacterium]|nr:GAF domain-containing protein [Bacilli bacterium]MCI2111098.1 GAF domain-containing protein [Bacilli bacterium]